MPTPISNVVTNPLAPKTTTSPYLSGSLSGQVQAATSQTAPLVLAPGAGYTQTSGGTQATGGYTPSTPVKSISTDGQGGTTTTFHPQANYTTPSGAQVNAQGGLVAPPPSSGQTQNQVTYPGLVSSLAQNAQAGSPVAGAAAQGLMSTALNNPLTSGQAYQNYDQAVQRLNQLRSGIASMEGNIESEPIPLEFQQGREQALSRQYASQLDASQQAVNQAQQALGYGIQEQQTQQAGLTSAGNLGNTGQGLLQSGLTSAAGLAAPNAGAAFYGNPLTGGTYGTGNYGSGPAAGANVQSIQSQTQTINDLSAARQSATNLQGQLTSFIQSNGINPSDFNAVNKFLQNIGAQTSSPQYQTFSNLVNDLASVYAQVLTPAGGSQTDMVRTIAQSLVNATASGQSINTVLQNLDLQAQNKIQGIQTNVQNIQSGNNVNPAPGTGATGGDIWSF